MNAWQTGRTDDAGCIRVAALAGCRLCEALLADGTDELAGAIVAFDGCLPAKRTSSAKPRLHTGAHHRRPGALLERTGIAVLLSWLAEQGFSILGQGDDAVVLAAEGRQWGLRIGKSPAAYTSFVARTMASRSPHFPRFWGHAVRDAVSASCIELLDHPDEEDVAFWQRANAAICYAYGLADNRPRLPAPPPSSLLDAVALLADGCRRDGWALDMDVANILCRSRCGDIVFTDAWAQWEVQ